MKYKLLQPLTGLSLFCDVKIQGPLQDIPPLLLIFLTIYRTKMLIQIIMQF